MEDHDLAVARVSHLPHLMSALAAGTLADAPSSHLELSGQGVRDVTRIAAGDPRLWTQIVSANSTALTGLLEQIRGELDRLLVALGKEEAGEELTAILGQGVSGAVRVPGKHGTPHIDLVTGPRHDPRPPRPAGPACSPTPPSPAPTSKTSASTTAPAAPSVRSSWPSSRPRWTSWSRY